MTESSEEINNILEKYQQFVSVKEDENSFVSKEKSVDDTKENSIDAPENGTIGGAIVPPIDNKTKETDSSTNNFDELYEKLSLDPSKSLAKQTKNKMLLLRMKSKIKNIPKEKQSNLHQAIIRFKEHARGLWICGNVFDIRDVIQETGATWDNAKKCWMISKKKDSENLFKLLRKKHITYNPMSKRRKNPHVTPRMMRNPSSHTSKNVKYDGKLYKLMINPTGKNDKHAYIKVDNEKLYLRDLKGKIQIQ